MSAPLHSPLTEMEISPTPKNNVCSIVKGEWEDGSTSADSPGSKFRIPIPDHLQLVLNACSEDNPGKNADYIPELRDADSNRLGVAVSTVDGFVYTAGDVDVPFSIQSISKAFVYALAIEEHGLDYVLTRVGVEPSGEAFNELSLEQDTCRPLNPMINAGAITTHTLIGKADTTYEERFEMIRKGLSKFAGRELEVDENVYNSEMKHAFRNLAIANMLRNYNVFDLDPKKVVEGYTRQCATLVTAKDLAVMAATLANTGIQPITGEQVVRPQTVRQTLSVMMTCGMYDGAGDWVTKIGFPAKSGVAGGIIGALPGQVGISTFSPKLDKHGNSLRGVRICKRLSDDMGLHIMHQPEPARSVVRRHYVLKNSETGMTAAVLALQGTITFTPAERVLRVIAERSAEVDYDPEKARLVLDFRAVHHVDETARRMIRESVTRIRQAGFTVIIVDPEGLLQMTATCADKDAVEKARTLGRLVDGVDLDLDKYKGWEVTEQDRISM